MKDVVLPIYGSQTDLPAESVAQKLLNLVLAEDGILLEEFNNLPSGFILKGGYRKLSKKILILKFVILKK